MMIDHDRKVSITAVRSADDSAQCVHAGERAGLRAQSRRVRQEAAPQCSFAARLAEDEPPGCATLGRVHPTQQLHGGSRCDEIATREAGAVGEEEFIRIEAGFADEEGAFERFRFFVGTARRRSLVQNLRVRILAVLQHRHQQLRDHRRLDARDFLAVCDAGTNAAVDTDAGVTQRFAKLHSGESRDIDHSFIANHVLVVRNRIDWRRIARREIADFPTRHDRDAIEARVVDDDVADARDPAVAKGVDERREAGRLMTRRAERRIAVAFHDDVVVVEP